MKTAIENSKMPKFGNMMPFAEFKIVLKRVDGMIELECKSPRCFRDFRQFTGAEKDAYWAIVTHVVETAAAALHRVQDERSAKHGNR
jgi:hypothetical protein